MDRVSRLIAWLALGICLMASPAVFAGTQYCVSGGSCYTSMESSQADAVAAFHAATPDTPDGSASWYTNGAYNCSAQGTTTGSLWSCGIQMVCRAPSYHNADCGTSSAGTGGTLVVTTETTPPPDSFCTTSLGHALGDKGQTVSVPTTGITVPTSICAATDTPGHACRYDQPASSGGEVFGIKFGTTQQYIYDGDAGRFKGSGTACNPALIGTAGDANSLAQPSGLKKGNCPGQVNGVDVPGGVPCDKTVTTPAAAASSATTTGSSAPGAVAGTVGATTSSECSGSNCTVTTTTTTVNPDGTTTTKVESKQEAKETLCQEHPTDAQCGTGDDAESSFSGDCAGLAAVVQCDGDAVQCAMAKQQKTDSCRDHANADGANGSALENALYAQAGASQPDGHPRLTAEVHDFGSSIDQTDLMGAGCPADVVVPMGALPAVSLPLSRLCAPAAMLGNILVGITAIACIGIVFVRGK